MKPLKTSHILTALIAALAVLAALLAVTGTAQAQSDPRAERLNSTTQRLYVWQLERDGIYITKADRLYRVVNGDRWDTIASRYGITVEQLLGANPQVKSVNELLRGELLHIPSGITETAPPFYATPQTTILSGTVSGVPESSQARLNTTSERLYVWQLERDGIRITKEDRMYRVVSGDSVNTIARRYGITVDTLLSANPQVTNVNMIYRNELLRIPEGITETAPAFYASPVAASTSK